MYTYIYTCTYIYIYIYICIYASRSVSWTTLVSSSVMLVECLWPDQITALEKHADLLNCKWVHMSVMPVRLYVRTCARTSTSLLTSVLADRCRVCQSY